jgi:hypothetical protein
MRWRGLFAVIASTKGTRLIAATRTNAASAQTTKKQRFARHCS